MNDIRVILPTGRTYEVINASRKPYCIGTLRLVSLGDASNSNAPVYTPPPPPQAKRKFCAAPYA